MGKRDRQAMVDDLESQGLNGETFCLAPYINTDLDQDGSILICYRSKDRLGNWKESPFSETFNGEKIKKIRSDLMHGVRNKNCVSCWIAEDKGSVSPRMSFYYEHKEGEFDNHLPDDIYDIIKKDPEAGHVEHIARSELRPSALCNQRCMHCGPHSSTKWIETIANKDNYDLYAENTELLKQGLGPIDHIELTNENVVKHYKSSLTSYSTHKQDIMELLSNSQDINFTGGEPLLTPEHLEYLDYFVNVSGTAKQKTLVYSSNLNIRDIEKYFPYWRAFRKVSFRVSIDSSFDTYDYFRTYGDNTLLKSSIRKIQKLSQECRESGEADIRMVGSITFNMFSALRWRQIVQDWSDFGLEFHSSLVLNNPTGVKYLPKDLSQKALSDMQWTLDNIQQFYTDPTSQRQFEFYTQDCMNFIKGYDNQFTEFEPMIKKYIDFCDKTSGNSVFDYYPELESYLK